MEHPERLKKILKGLDDKHEVYNLEELVQTYKEMVEDENYQPPEPKCPDCFDRKFLVDGDGGGYPCSTCGGK